MEKEQIRILLKKILEKGIELKKQQMSEEQKRKCEEKGINPEKVILMSHAVYPEEVFLISSELEKFNYFDVGDYNKNFQELLNKYGENIPIENLDLSQIKTYLTCIYRGERFNEGYIKNFIDNGIFERLINKLLELI